MNEKGDLEMSGNVERWNADSLVNYFGTPGQAEIQAPADLEAGD